VAETTVQWGEIQGRSITFPMEVTDMNLATLMFSVPAEAAANLLPGDAFEIVEVAPGIAQFVMALCEYRENPWGDYNEVNLGFLARPASQLDEVGSFVYRMPVDQEFTCEAGNKVMGFPKTVEHIDVDYSDDEVTFRLVFDGQLAFVVGVPRVPATGDPTRIDTVSYSYLDGRPYATSLEMDLATGIVADPEDVRIELGEGVVATELASLGLPKAPDFCSWGEGLSATFHVGHPVAG